MLVCLFSVVLALFFLAFLEVFLFFMCFLRHAGTQVPTFGDGATQKHDAFFSSILFVSSIPAPIVPDVPTDEKALPFFGAFFNDANDVITKDTVVVPILEPTHHVPTGKGTAIPCPVDHDTKIPHRLHPAYTSIQSLHYQTDLKHITCH